MNVGLRPPGNRRRFLVVLGLLLGWLLATSGHAAKPDRIELTVLLTADLHAHFGEAAPNDPGWLRLAAVIRREQEAVGGPTHCVLLDSGGFFAGSLPPTLPRGQAAQALFNRLGYDAWVPGEAELAAGIPALTTLTKDSVPPALCANLWVNDRRLLPAWRLFEKQGARIAVIGLTAVESGQDFWGSRFTGARCEPALVALERIAGEVMRAAPDLTIALIHNGWQRQDKPATSEVKLIAARFPQVHLILGGRIGKACPGQLVEQAWYARPDPDGASLARIRLQLDRAAARVTVLDSRLLSAAEVEPNPECTTALAPLFERSRQLAAQPIAKLPVAVISRGTPGHSSHFSEIVCRAVAWKSGARFAFHGRPEDVVWEHVNQLTEGMLGAALPREDTLAVAHLTAAELTAIVEEQLAVKGKDEFNGPWGFFVRVDREREKVVGLYLLDNRELPRDQRFPVAFSSAVAAGDQGRFPVLREILLHPEAKVREVPVSVRDAVREFVQQVPGWHQPPLPWLEYTK